MSSSSSTQTPSCKCPPCKESGDSSEFKPGEDPDGGNNGAGHHGDNPPEQGGGLPGGGGAPGTGGDGALANTTSGGNQPGGMNTNNGEVTLSSDAAMGSTGLGLNFSTRLNYLSQGGGLSYGFGSNWIFPALTGLKVSDTTGPADSISYQTSSDSTLLFQEGSTAGTYEASYYVRDVLTWKSSNKTYILTSPSGAQRIFGDVPGIVKTVAAG